MSTTIIQQTGKHIKDPVWDTKITNWTVIDDKTVTFTCRPFEPGASTTYELWLNNKEELLSAVHNRVFYTAPKE